VIFLLKFAPINFIKICFQFSANETARFNLSDSTRVVACIKAGKKVLKLIILPRFKQKKLFTPMKRCPNCNQIFDDENAFCLNDGTVLEIFSPSSVSEMPTEILSPFPAQPSLKPGGDKNIYAIVGAMAVVIIGLSAIVFFLLRDKGPAVTRSENNQQPTQLSQNKSAQVSSNSATGQTSENTQPKTQQITNAEVQDLIDRWVKAQDEKNFGAYSACYSPQQFLGIKRTKEGGRRQYTYTEWMSDRRKMLTNIIDLEIEIPQIAIEDDTAVAQFNQKFRSVNYCDEGPKEMRIKMFPEGAKIIYEAMKASQSCF